ncbi:MAG: ROK family protein [Candidatus Hermodarchaeota archaeon]
MNHNQKFIIGVDIGGTWIRVAICTQDLKEENIKIKMINTPKDNKFSISTSVTTLISKLLAENNLKEDQVLGIGLACAGPIDMNSGEVFNNANLGFKEIPIKKPIHERFPSIPIYLINDCNAAVLGVHYFEANEDEKENLAYITVSTGIGGGAIVDGHLLVGKDGNAAEVGHGKVEPKSILQCNCGSYGCWEVYSSGTGVLKRTLEAIDKGDLKSEILFKLVKNDPTKITAKEVFQAAREGDQLSKAIVDQCIFYMKVGIGLTNNFYDCTTIYFGGAMMKDKDQILPPIIEQFEKEPIIFTVNHPPQLKATKYREDIGLRGALALIKYKTENSPILDML